MTPIPSVSAIDPWLGTAAGSGVIVYVTVVAASSQTLYTFTEGGDWSATADQDSTLTALASRINTAMINTGVTCLPVFRNYSTLREIILVPVTYVGGSIPGETSAPVDIQVRIRQPGSPTLTIFESKSHAGGSIDMIGPFADGSFHP